MGPKSFSGRIGPCTLLLVLIVCLIQNCQPGVQSVTVLAAEKLRCEYLAEPLGIDSQKPRLSWICKSDVRNQKQGAYQILVADDLVQLKGNLGNLWDSGKVPSSATNQIEYAGKPLSSLQKCFWKVRLWDAENRVTEYSQPSYWQMGLLSETDWKGQWLGLKRVSTSTVYLRGNWIQHPEKLPHAPHPELVRYLRKPFVLPFFPVKQAVIDVAADDSAEIYLNGRLVAANDAVGIPSRVDVTECVSKGENVIAVALRKTHAGRMGLLFSLEIQGDTDERLSVVSDGTWRSSIRSEIGWNTHEFDGGQAWLSVNVLGANGIKPWGRVGRLSPGAPSLYLRKEFMLKEAVNRAMLVVTARGVYEMYINGKRVGDEVLSPGWTDYRKRFQYQIFDVTDQLRSGENSLGAIVGDGWYAGHIGWVKRRHQYGKDSALLTQLHIEYRDGEEKVIASDDSWKASTGPILYSDLLMGESYDANLEMPGWNLADYNEENWQTVRTETRNPVEMVPRLTPPMRVVERIEAVNLVKRAEGRYIFDLGQNIAGWVRLKIREPGGTKVTLRHSEILNRRGNLYLANLRIARATDHYVTRGGGEEVFEPRFTFHGFRYVEVSGLRSVPLKGDLQGCVVSSDLPLSAAFSSSSDLVNRLFQNIYWGQRGNFISIPTDCPQRDERLGWMGDAQIFVSTAGFIMDVAPFFSKWMTDVLDAQSEEGAFKDVAPFLPGLLGSGDGSPGWGDAGIIVPWEIYRMYGDRRILRRCFPAMERWMVYLLGANPDYVRRNRLNNNYGDWLAIGATTPKDLLATAYWARCAALMAGISGVLNLPAETERYKALFANIKTAFIDEYLEEDGRLRGHSQTAYLLALDWDLLPSENRPQALAHLVADIDEKNNHLSTGFLGVRHLNPVLSTNGHNELAYRLLLNETFPSWGYSIRQGATTIWERWDGWTEESGFQDPGMNSFNHYSFGSIGEWLFSYVCGLRMNGDLPGYREFTIKPYPGPGLNRAGLDYDSINGTISSRWQLQDGGRFLLDVTVPANTVAHVFLPSDNPDTATESGLPLADAEAVTLVGFENGRIQLKIGSGTYRFICHIRE